MALTTIQSGMLDSSSQYTGFKNRIINGGMAIAQRTTGTVYASGFPVDRFICEFSGSGNISARQSTDVPTGAGFTNSLFVNVVTADTSVTGTEYYQFTQYVEGTHVADFAWGTASAANVALSFWAKSSGTGTFSAAVHNINGERGYPSSFTINTANTWEYKTIVIPGSTTGTWVANTGTYLGVRIGLAYGATYGGATANTWVTASSAATAFNAGFVTTTNTVMSAISGNLYVTGIQLEKGSSATNFDNRPYGAEFQLCQRYYQLFSNYTLEAYQGAAGFVRSLKNILPFPVAMRATPIRSIVTAGAFTNVRGSSTDYAGIFPATATYAQQVIETNNATGSSAYTGATDAMNAELT